ncbi:MAG: integrase arm-type DNA-binding domain-containing protein, partial [Alphaproteobacteria bacterium]
MTKLTKRNIETIQPTDRDFCVWDDDMPGLGLRVLPSGRKQFIVQYRAGRRSRRITLGPTTIITPEQARARAMAILSEARNGQDPAADKEAYRKALMVSELAERFDEEHIALRLKASTAREYRRNLERFILPALGRLRVVDVTRADIAKFHHDLRRIPYQANRCLEII